MLKGAEKYIFILPEKLLDNINYTIDELQEINQCIIIKENCKTNKQ